MQFFMQVNGSKIFYFNLALLKIKGVDIYMVFDIYKNGVLRYFNFLAI
jgi:hypothetical protein